MGEEMVLNYTETLMFWKQSGYKGSFRTETPTIADVPVQT